MKSDKFRQTGIRDYSGYDTQEFWDYVERYAAFIKEYEYAIDHYVNVDVIFNPELTWKVQKYLEDEHGLSPMPVIHWGTPLEWVKRYVKEGYELIGLGGLGQEATKDLYYDWADRVYHELCPKSNGRKPIVKTHGFAMTAYDLLIRYPWYCMTNRHEVLTKEGWKGSNEVQVGDMILAYTKDGTSKWEPVLEVPKFQLENEELYHLKNRNFSAQVTSNHRWRVKQRNGTWKWMTTEEWVGKGHRVPRRAEHTDFPTKETYSDEVIELLAWYWTDGTLRPKNGKYHYISIYQSDKTNPHHVKEITKLMERCGSKWCVSSLKARPWEKQFEISGANPVCAQVLEITKLSKEKHFPLEFILALTERQLHLFIETTLKGDGGWDSRMVREKSFVLPQKDGRNLEVFRVAAMLAGYATSIQNKGRFLRSSSVPWVYGDNLKVKKKKYTGEVWCVRVESKAFFTRCDGHVYVTGNSVDSASWCKAGGFGMIYVPRTRNGEFAFHHKDEDGIRQPVFPYNISVSTDSPAVKTANRSLHNISKSAQRVIHKWLDKIEVPLGSVDKDGKMKEWGVVSTHSARKIANLKFFEAMCNSLPEWPWAFKGSPRASFLESV